MAKSPHLSRNEFVKVVVGAVGTLIGAVIALPAIAYLLDPMFKSIKAKAAGEAWVPAGPVENFQIGTPQLVSYTRTVVNGWERTTTSYGAYILRENDTDTKAFSNICTHLACRVTWNNDQQLYLCPCHDARFTKEGAVAGGPPPRPMDQFPTKTENGTIYFNSQEKV